MRTCDLPDCDRKHYGRGLCRMHWMRQRTHGDASTTLYDRQGAPDHCVISDCERPHHSHGLCSRHDHRRRRHGVPTAGGPHRLHGPLADRLARFIVPNDAGCWIWTGSCDRDGYGWIGTGDGAVRRAHIVTFELYVGPVPEGLELDHTCVVPPCVNPAHLDPVTHLENVRRIYERTS
jgi:hypothetical protein